MQHSAYLDRPSAKSLFESKKRSLLWEIRKSSKLALKWTFICKKSGFASFLLWRVHSALKLKISFEKSRPCTFLGDDWNMVKLGAHPSFYRLFIKGKLDVYLLWPFGKKALLIRNMHWYFMVIIFLFNQYPFSVLITKDRKSFSCYKERFKNPFKRCAVFVCLNIASCFHFGCLEL